MTIKLTRNKSFGLTALLLLVLAGAGCASQQSVQPMSSAISAKPGNLAGQQQDQVGGGRRQAARNWCWAACIEDVENSQGIFYSQQQIAGALTGYAYDRPANMQEVTYLLNWVGLRAWIVNRPATEEELFGTLANGYKIIALINPAHGGVGHFVVIEGRGANGGIIVYDPLTGYTQEIPDASLYINQWMGSVVVGR